MDRVARARWDSRAALDLRKALLDGFRETKRPDPLLSNEQFISAGEGYELREPTGRVPCRIFLWYGDLDLHEIFDELQ